MVATRMPTAWSQEGDCSVKLTRNTANIMNPIWSMMGSSFPGSMFILRLKKEPMRSPPMAPMERRAALRGVPWAMPTRKPAARPETVPRRVLWSPKRGFPSIQFRPLSREPPPLSSTGVAFAM